MCTWLTLLIIFFGVLVLVQIQRGIHNGMVMIQEDWREFASAYTLFGWMEARAMDRGSVGDSL